MLREGFEPSLSLPIGDQPDDDFFSLPSGFTLYSPILAPLKSNNLNQVKASILLQCKFTLVISRDYLF